MPLKVTPDGTMAHVVNPATDVAWSLWEFFSIVELINPIPNSTIRFTPGTPTRCLGFRHTVDPSSWGYFLVWYNWGKPVVSWVKDNTLFKPIQNLSLIIYEIEWPDGSVPTLPWSTGIKTPSTPNAIQSIAANVFNQAYENIIKDFPDLYNEKPSEPAPEMPAEVWRERWGMSRKGVDFSAITRLAALSSKEK